MAHALTEPRRRPLPGPHQFAGKSKSSDSSAGFSSLQPSTPTGALRRVRLRPLPTIHHVDPPVGSSDGPVRSQASFSGVARSRRTTSPLPAGNSAVTATSKLWQDPARNELRPPPGAPFMAVHFIPFGVVVARPTSTSRRGAAGRTAPRRHCLALVSACCLLKERDGPSSLASPS